MTSIKNKIGDVDITDCFEAANTIDDIKASIKTIEEIDIDTCFSVDSFEALTTEHFQAKFYRDHFNLAVSCALYVLHWGSS